MNELCGCGRPLIARSGELEPTCAECRLKADHCACSPLSDTAQAALSETARPVTRRSNETNGSNAPDDSALLAGIRDGAWLHAQTFPPLLFAIPGLIPEGLTLVIGAPKVGKSWLILDLLLGVASGGVALGHLKAGEPRRVLYLALEDSDRRMQDRCRALLGTSQAIPHLFSYQTRVMAGAALPTVAAWMRLHPDTALVVIDTLGKVMPPAMQGESAYQRDYRIGGHLKAQADAHPGLAVVVLHHDRKASADDFVDSVSGTHGLAGAADTIAVLARRRQSDEGLLKITGRDVPESEYGLTFTDGRAWQIDGGDLRSAAIAAASRQDTRSLSDTSAEIIDFVRRHDGGVRAKEVVERFGQNAYTYLKRLEESGRIDKLGRGIYIVSAPRMSEPSEVSELQLSEPEEYDTGTAGVRMGPPSWPDGSIGESTGQ